MCKQCVLHSNSDANTPQEQQLALRHACCNNKNNSSANIKTLTNIMERKKNYYQDLYNGCYIHTKNYILKYHYIHYYSNKYPIIIQNIYIDINISILQRCQRQHILTLGCCFFQKGVVRCLQTTPMIFTCIIFKRPQTTPNDSKRPLI